MAGRTKELCLVLLDVGPHMHPYLDQAGKAFFNFVQSKLLFKPNHEVAIIFFGTTGTANDLNREQAAEGEAGQYLHISVQQDLRCTSLEHMRGLATLPRGSGLSDHINALLVAIDMLIKAKAARPDLDKAWEKLARRVLLVSSFDYPVEAMDDETRDALVQQFQSMKLSLDVVCVACNSAPDEAQRRASNVAQLHDLLAEVSGHYQELSQPAQLLGLFRIKEVAPTSLYKGNLSIGSGLNIPVKVYKKTMSETLPGLKVYNPESITGNHEVLRETEYRAPSQEGPVPPEERVKAYRYGRQNVPVAREDEEALVYKPDKCLQLVGTLEASRVPRHVYMKDALVLLADTSSDDRPGVAVSALARALARDDRLLVLRGVLRAGSAPVHYAASPLLAAAPELPDALVLNALPFADDMRPLVFRSFSATANSARPQLLPSADQAKAAALLVRYMDLAAPQQAGGAAARELLRPETTANPVLQRFFSFLGSRALNPDAAVPEADELVTAVCDPPLSQLPTVARETLANMARHFHTEAPQSRIQAAAGAAEPLPGAGAEAALAAAPSQGEAGGKPAASVSMATPEDDFEALVAAGQLEDALAGMQTVIPSIVSASVGGRLYDRALAATQVLRATCVEHARPQVFNALLDQLLGSFKGDAVHAGFWLKLMGAGVAPISNLETAAEGALDAAAAADFVRVHSGADVKQEAASLGAGAAPSSGMAAAAAAAAALEDDEFADME